MVCRGPELLVDEVDSRAEAGPWQDAPSRGVDGGQRLAREAEEGKRVREVEGKRPEGRRKALCGEFAGTLRGFGGGHVRRSQWVRGSGTETGEVPERGPMSETGGRTEKKKTSRMFSQHPRGEPSIFFQPVSGEDKAMTCFPHVVASLTIPKAGPYGVNDLRNL